MRILEGRETPVQIQVWRDEKPFLPFTNVNDKQTKTTGCIFVAYACVLFFGPLLYLPTLRADFFSRPHVCSDCDGVQTVTTDKKKKKIKNGKQIWNRVDR